MDWFSSDWHISHQSCIRFSNRPFETVEEMDKIIIDNMINATKKGDNMFFLGDLSFDKNNIFGILKRFKNKGVNFHWIIGNHDEKYKPMGFSNLCTFIGDKKTIKREGCKIFMSHMPHMTWDSSHYNSWHLYGHIHDFSPELNELNRRMDGKSLNVNCEFNDYKPFSFDDIVKIMGEKPDNFDYVLLQNYKNSIINKGKVEKAYGNT